MGGAGADGVQEGRALPLPADRAGITFFSRPDVRASFYAAGALMADDRDTVATRNHRPRARKRRRPVAPSAPETGSDPRDARIGLDLPPDRWFASVGPEGTADQDRPTDGSTSMTAELLTPGEGGGAEYPGRCRTVDLGQLPPEQRGVAARTGRPHTASTTATADACGSECVLWRSASVRVWGEGMLAPGNAERRGRTGHRACTCARAECMPHGLGHDRRPRASEKHNAWYSKTGMHRSPGFALGRGGGCAEAESVSRWRRTRGRSPIARDVAEVAPARGSAVQAEVVAGGGPIERAGCEGAGSAGARRWA